MASPVDITGALPYDGTMFDNNSYYVVGGLTPTTTYTVTLTNVTSGGSLEIYSDSGFTTLMDSSNGAVNLPETTTGTANASGKIFIQVDTAGLSGSSGTTYKINVQ